MTKADPPRSRLMVAMAIAFGSLGLWTASGGAWLLALGGSPYYLLAGTLLLASAWLLLRRRTAALWIYALLIVGTIAWALWEAGLDFWALAPRGDLIVILGIVLALPPVVHRLGFTRWPGPAWPLVGSVLLAVLIAGASLLSDRHDLVGSLPGPRGPVSPATYGGSPQRDWIAYGRSWRGDRWSPLTQITPANVTHLQKAWEFHTGDFQRPGDPEEFTYEVTPIKVGSLVYLCSPHNIVFALGAETGRQVWRFDPHITASKEMQHLTCRGVSYHSAAMPGAERAPNGDCPDRIIMGTNDARLIALDAHSGHLCRSFGNKGEIDVWPGLPGQPRGWWQITSPR